MITEAILKRQIARLKALPRGEERPWDVLREELLKYLWRVCASDEHAERIINKAIETSEFCPSPMELIRIGEEVSPIAPAQAKRQGCEVCGGIGYVTKLRRARALPGLPEREYDYAVPCSCSRALAGAK